MSKLSQTLPLLGLLAGATFLLLLVQQTVNADPEQKGQQRQHPKLNPEVIFKKIDSNDDGTISQEEFTVAFKNKMERLKKMMGHMKHPQGKHPQGHRSPGHRSPGDGGNRPGGHAVHIHHHHYYGSGPRMHSGGPQRHGHPGQPRHHHPKRDGDHRKGKHPEGTSAIDNPAPGDLDVAANDDTSRFADFELPFAGFDSEAGVPNGNETD